MLETAPSEGGLTVQAPAKVNLTLRVLGRRPDGYHDLESVVAAVTLFDVLEFSASDDLHLACEGIPVSAGEDNLVLRAARLLRTESGTHAGARVRLEKRIPPGRGFGGGSADAAATLVALDALWGLNRTREDLVRLGARVGSDVPFFFGSPVAILRGRGERLEAVRARPTWWLVLAWPGDGRRVCGTGPPGGKHEQRAGGDRHSRVFGRSGVGGGGAPRERPRGGGPRHPIRWDGPEGRLP